MPTTPAPLESEIQALVAAYKLLDLELSASSYAIDHWYRQLSLLNQPDRYPEGTPDQFHAAEKRRQIDAAYQLIRTAPLRDHPLAKAAAAREEDRVRDPGLAIDRPVSVATETVARLALGVALGLFFAYQLHRQGSSRRRDLRLARSARRGHPRHVLHRVDRGCLALRVPETVGHSGQLATGFTPASARARRINDA